MSLDRFFSKIDVGNSPAGCWIWTASRLGRYGSFQHEKRTCLAHRVSYEMHVGPIPEGCHIDHLCRETLCVNPLHLEPVTPSENAQRGIRERPGNGPKRGPRCPVGHAYDEDNTYINPNGKRICRACRTAKQRAKRAAGRTMNKGAVHV